MNKVIEPKTARLQLRQWRDSDREPFAVMSADPRVMEFFPSTLNREQSDAIIDFCCARISDRGWGIWAVEEQSSNRFVGMVGLDIPREDLPPSPCVEILWRLSADYWGCGYATEAANAALQVGFEEVELEEIVAFVVPSNVRSRAVMQRLGMVDTDKNFGHPAVPETSDLHEHCLYTLSRAIWKSGNAGRSS